MNWFVVFWICWLMVLAIGFAVVETIAMRNKKGLKIDTLSSFLQWLFAHRKGWHYATLFVWGAFATWFAAHLWG